MTRHTHESLELIFAIDEDLCINCGSCRRHCPFEAIEYSFQHQILPDACTGCTLCYAVCPVTDCITPVPAEADIPNAAKLPSLRSSLLRNNSYWTRRTLSPSIKKRAGNYLIRIKERSNDKG